MNMNSLKSVLVLLLLGFLISVSGEKIEAQEPITIEFSGFTQELALQNSLGNTLVNQSKTSFDIDLQTRLSGTSDITFKVISERNEGDWRLLSIALDDPACYLDGNFSFECSQLVVAHKEGDQWQSAIAGTEKYSQLLDNVPFLDQRTKAILDPLHDDPDLISQDHRFPWAAGDREINRVWHSSKSGGNAIDFTGSGDILASADGTITNICVGTSSKNVRIMHDDGVELDYFHLDRTLGPGIVKGRRVVKGQYLGFSRVGSFSEDGCGHSYGTHLHLDFVNPSTSHMVGNAPGYYTFEGWTIQYAWNDRTKKFTKGDDSKGKGDDITSTNIRVDCDTNAPYIGSNFCKRQTLVQPQDNGSNQGYIEMFSGPLGQEGSVGVGRIRPTGLGSTTGEFRINEFNDNPTISWEVYWNEESIHEIYPDFVETHHPNSAFWIAEGDVKELTLPPFKDIQYSHTFFKDITLAKKYEFVHGFSSGLYRSNIDINRRDTALVIYRWLHDGANPTCEDIGLTTEIVDNRVDCSGVIVLEFVDVTDWDNASHRAVHWLAREGYLTTTRYCPSGPVYLPCFEPDVAATRAEFVKMIIDAFRRRVPLYDQIMSDLDDCSDYGDVETDHPQYQSIMDACKLEFIRGKHGVFDFNPDISVGRGAAAKILTRAYLKMIDSPLLQGSSIQFQVLDVEPATCDFDFCASDELLSLRWLASAVLEGDSVCKLYSIHDEGLRDSEFFHIDFATLEESVNSFSGLYDDTDIEALDISPDFHLMYAVASYQGNQDSELYLVNSSGELFLIGVIENEDGKGFKEVDSLSFHPDGTLWGFARSGSRRGIIKIDPKTAIAELVAESDISLQGIAWEPDGDILWLTGDSKKLYTFTIGDSIIFEYNLDVPDRIESLEFRPDGLLWIGGHHSGAINIFTLDVETGQFIASDSLNTNEFEDVEGLAWPEWCTEEFPAFTEINHETGGTLTSLDGQTEIILSPGAISENTVFGLTEINVSESTPNEMAYANHAFRLNAYQNSEKIEDFTFNQPISVTVYYANTSGVNEETLQLYYWDRGNAMWVDASCGDYERNLNENTVRVPICHLTEFALFGEPSIIYLPIVFK